MEWLGYTVICVGIIYIPGLVVLCPGSLGMYLSILESYSCNRGDLLEVTFAFPNCNWLLDTWLQVSVQGRHRLQGHLQNGA